MVMLNRQTERERERQRERESKLLCYRLERERLCSCIM